MLRLQGEHRWLGQIFHQSSWREIVHSQPEKGVGKVGKTEQGLASQPMPTELVFPD